MIPRFSFLLLLALAVVIAAANVHAHAAVTVVQSEHASLPERLAADELTERLQRIYPDEQFVRAATLPPSGPAILVASLAGDSAVFRPFLSRDSLPEAESFLVTHLAASERPLGIVAGADSRGVVYGIYALLERLGCGFYLSDEVMPEPRPGPLSFADWSLADAPLFSDRIVLNWHNFLSSATTWEFADWQRYIDAATRLRFNDLMVHAYGNNPMFTFAFNGVTKPVGYFATTQQGRDWGTQHVNDVRRMIGGEAFDAPVFGASVAPGEPAQRVAAATALMRRVFAHARARGLGVTFALDVDTPSANPPELIATLPANARFRSGPHELANPDTPEGFAFYQAQVDQLLACYPDLTRIAVWFRSPDSKTPWRRLQRSEMPVAWQHEFTGPDEDVSAFALAKIVQAFRRALEHTGRSDVQLAAGSWAFPFLAASDRYIPRDIPLIALDWWVSFDQARALRDLQRVRSGRPLIPIVWAHHDDRTYVGRPYTPFVDFAAKLRRVGASGYGILHWTTRPLDLYFEGTRVQTWRTSENQPFDVSCDDVAERWFGRPARELGGQYLFAWGTEAPMFGRETTAHFIDHPLPTPELHAQLGQTRVKMLDQLATLPLTRDGADRLAYFRSYEQFMLAFFATETAAARAAAALHHGNAHRARDELRALDPAGVIRQFAATIQHGGATVGEKAVLVSLNLRWLPHVLSLRQAAGLEPIRYRLGHVAQEPLAQGAEPNTYHFDEHQRLWKILDRTTLPEVLQLGAISGDKLAPGRYAVTGVGEFEARDGLLEIPRAALPDEIVITRQEPSAR